MRLLLEDFAHYATLRKPRRGEDATLVFDEFSAIAGGREAAIQLVERVRDAGCALYLSAQSADGLGDEAQQRRLVGACSGGLLIHAMPDPETLLRAAGVVKVVEQTWRLDQAGPTGNSSARIGERPRIEPGAVQQAREGEAWYIARGRFEHLMVARTTISDGYRARAHAMVALARSWRPAEVLPGARTWIEAQAAAQGTLAGLRGHLAIEPPPDSLGTDLPPEPSRPAPAGHRLRLAVAAAARDGDQDGTAALVREGPRPRRRGGRVGGGGRGPLAQAWLASSRLAGRTVLDDDSAAAATPSPRPGGVGRTGAPAMTGALRLPARNGLACGAARGNPAPARAPAGCLLVGLPPRPLRRQGRCGTRCAPFLASLRDGLRPALTAPAPTRPGETRSPGAGEEQSPTSRQEARTVADHPGTPTPAGTC